MVLRQIMVTQRADRALYARAAGSTDSAGSYICQEQSLRPQLSPFSCINAYLENTLET
jgi:hypothetical protein